MFFTFNFYRQDVSAEYKNLTKSLLNHTILLLSV